MQHADILYLNNKYIKYNLPTRQRHIVIYEFNLALPTAYSIENELHNFNCVRKENNLPFFLPELNYFRSDGEICGVSLFLALKDVYLYSARMQNDKFRVHGSFFDADKGVLYEFVEYLTIKYMGTLIGIYITPDEGITPVRIVEGVKYLDVSLAMISKHTHGSLNE